MKVLVIGSGGREHALCWKLSQSPRVSALYAAPGNPGMAPYTECVPTSDYVALADRIQPDLTIVGPETPLAEGVVDRFRQRNWPIVGPSASAARIETSKAFSKTLMLEAGVPTARHTTAGSEQEAWAALRGFPLPVVLKADGLAAGKGVVIAHTLPEARRAVAELLAHSPMIVIEEYLTGEEASFIVLTDGANVVPLEAAQDHKAIYDGDQGPNTGGMGAYSDGRILSNAVQRQIVDSVVLPVLDVMRSIKCHFSGFLYAGLMMTANGPRVLEFNCRLGDPETQVILERMKSDFVPALVAAAGGDVSGGGLEWKPEPAVCVVLAAEGYPAATRTGDAITGVGDVRDATVFQAGTKSSREGLVTAGGRVLGVTASGPTLQGAIDIAYAGVRDISFPGMQYRTDIGQKGLKRW